MGLVARTSVFLYAPAEQAREMSQYWIQSWQPCRYLWLAQHADSAQNILSQQQARLCLGSEFDVVIFDGTQQFNADAFAIAIGTLRGGGVLLVWLPVTANNAWFTRLNHHIKVFSQQSGAALCWQPGDATPPIAFSPSTENAFKLTTEQYTALSAIHQVVKGPSHQPLLLTADRGRGKSTALGIAAAQILQSGQQQIWVTAPSFSTVATLFKHAAKTLNEANIQAKSILYQDAALRFIAPDKLLAEQPLADLLIVDEAAAIPQGMLQLWLKRYSRIVFASTLQGYEGSGKGLSLRFQGFLQKHTPQWQQVTLSQPVRWAESDPLEQFSISALLLDCPLTALPVPAKFDSNQIILGAVDIKALLADEALLKDIVGLLVQAHYRTRPSDVQALLADPKRKLYVARNKQNAVIGALWLVSEGPLDSELAKAVHRGERRPNGDLLPQALLTHAGVFSAAQYHYQRVMRIAVHPAYQRLGVGSAMIKQLTMHLSENTDILGCSFSATPELIGFWQKNGFVPVKLGLHADTVTANHAMIMLKAISTMANDVIKQLQQRFAAQWPILIPCYFQQLDPLLVSELSNEFLQAESVFSAEDKRDIESFVFGQRALEFSFVPLQQLLRQQCSTKNFSSLNVWEQDLLNQLFLQQHSSQTVIKQTALQGHKTLLKTLRRLFGELLTD